MGIECVRGAIVAAGSARRPSGPGAYICVQHELGGNVCVELRILEDGAFEQSGS